MELKSRRLELVARLRLSAQWVPDQQSLQETMREAACEIERLCEALDGELLSDRDHLLKEAAYFRAALIAIKDLGTQHHREGRECGRIATRALNGEPS